MSQKHPVIAVTGSSGAGTSTVKNSFEHIFRRENLKAVVVEGDSFHRYDREAMKAAVAESEKNGGERLVILAQKRMNLRNWRPYSKNTVKAVPDKHVYICIMKKKRRLGIKSQVHSRLGRLLHQALISFFMKVCMVVLRVIPLMLQNMWIYWWGSCQSSIWNGYKKYSVTPTREVIQPKQLHIPFYAACMITCTI